jgi:gliding motility-associated-like protein
VVYIPNTFTPASSFTVNDQFGPEGLYIENYQMQIYNRWGEEVFSTSEGEKWDGTYNGELVPQGVYHYQIRVQSEDGTTRSFQGRVTVVR